MGLMLRRLALAAGAAGVAGLLGWGLLSLREREPVGAPRFPEFRPAREDTLLGSTLREDWSGRHLSADFDVPVRTNAHGQRGAPRVRDKPPGTWRILLVGDSFAFGWGVRDEECFAALLGPALERAAGDAADAAGAAGAVGAAEAASAANAEPTTAPMSRVEVINTGVPGWNIANQYVALQHSGLAWQPDLVLLQLCSNDLTDFGYFEYEFGARNLPVAVRPRPRLTGAERRQLIAEAAAARQLTPEQLVATLDAGELEALTAQGLGRLQAARREAAGAPPAGPIEALSAAEVRRGLDSGEAFQARYLAHVLGAVRELCSTRGVPLRVLAVDAFTLAGDPGQAALQALCAELGPACLPSEAFAPRAELAGLFFQRDPHWRAEGHRRAAAALGAWLAADPALPFAPR